MMNKTFKPMDDVIKRIARITIENGYSDEKRKHRLEAKFKTLGGLLYKLGEIPPRSVESGTTLVGMGVFADAVLEEYENAIMSNIGDNKSYIAATKMIKHFELTVKKIDEIVARYPKVDETQNIAYNVDKVASEFIKLKENL